ncbi:hypothetical protein SAV14893_088140 [Streptomyces avermitilis]|uniref:Uncharacterized protein n=1 Tax=Streptomyces avermitilis TaxID=33903 RepID=A0A4D4MBW7_STRAX|nr:hypothetical protein SAVMC3_08430 [Streptomyces avermitilis]GDY69421.1 hypothetical protein SAV14893_088140 [Streptomyces avermitilis]
MLRDLAAVQAAGRRVRGHDNPQRLKKGRSAVAAMEQRTLQGGKTMKEDHLNVDE